MPFLRSLFISKGRFYDPIMSFATLVVLKKDVYCNKIRFGTCFGLKLYDYYHGN